MAEGQSRFEEIAGRALAEYDLVEHTCTFIQHSDNATFKVEVPGGDAYVLRIHVPVSSAMGAHGADPAMVRSELQWLDALSRDTDLVLPEPVRNRTGALVTGVPGGDGSVPVNCTLMRWVEGQPYHRDLESEQTARSIGQVIATLHNHASQWTVPEGFTRPRRDIAYFESALATVKLAHEDGRIGQANWTQLEHATALVVEMLGAMAEDPQTHGIMHADTHKGNMLVDGGQMRLIDFSFCAFGNYMFDVGICMSDMKPRLHGAFLESYASHRPFPEDYEGIIEGHWIGSMVGTFSYWVVNPNAQELMARKVPEMVERFVSKYNRGERFLFS